MYKIGAEKVDPNNLPTDILKKCISRTPRSITEFRIFSTSSGGSSRKSHHTRSIGSRKRVRSVHFGQYTFYVTYPYPKGQHIFYLSQSVLNMLNDDPRYIYKSYLHSRQLQFICLSFLTPGGRKIEVLVKNHNFA